MNSKQFSIIICVYNLEDYISRAIDSVLNQDFKDFEIVVFNDGSTDNTLNILKKYEKSYSNIKIVDSKKILVWVLEEI